MKYALAISFEPVIRDAPKEIMEYLESNQTYILYVNGVDDQSVRSIHYNDWQSIALYGWDKEEAVERASTLKKSSENVRHIMLVDEYLNWELIK